MNRLLLTELVASCTPQELKWITDWLASPAHNQKESLSRLFDYLREYLHELNLEPETEAAFKAALPDQVFTKNRWSKLNFELTHLIEDCLIFNHHFQEANQRDPLVLDIYRKKGMDRHLQIRLKAGIRKLTQPRYASLDDYRYAHQVEQHRYLLQSGNNRSAEHNLAQAETALLNLIYAEKFRQFGRTLAHQRLLKSSTKPLLLEEIIATYEAASTSNQPGIHLFYLATLLYLNTAQKAEDIFHQLKKGIINMSSLMPIDDLRDLLVHAINYGVRQTNAGQKAYMRQTFELYQIGVSEHIFFINGEIDIFTFNNIIGLALRLEEVAYAESFLNKNVRYLPIEKREEVGSLNRARLAFQKKDYTEAIYQLQSADYKDFIHHLTARVIQLKIYFTRDDYNLLSAHIRATKSLLRRKKNVGYHQNNYRNIFSLAEKISKLPPHDLVAKKTLRQKIESAEPCTEKEWLLAQLS